MYLLRSMGLFLGFVLPAKVIKGSAELHNERHEYPLIESYFFAFPFASTVSWLVSLRMPYSVKVPSGYE